MRRSVCIVSPGNLSANPRLLKEADALHGAGYDVTAVVSDYSTGLRSFDDDIEAHAPWRVVHARRSPSERYVRVAASAAARLMDGVGARVPMPLAALACGGPVVGLHAAACAVPADLYIAHYVAALPAAGAAAQRHGALLGFDAEDFHSGEGTESPAEARRMAMVRIVEGAWLPRCSHLTAAAPLIGDAYASLYKVRRAGDRAERLSARHGADRAAFAAAAGSTAAGLLVLADHRARPRPPAVPAGDGPDDRSASSSRFGVAIPGATARR